MSAERVDGLLRAVVADLDRSSAAVVDRAEFDHYGSGFASFVEVVVTRRDGSATFAEYSTSMRTEGLSVLLCRLAPVACVCSGSWRSVDADGNSAASMVSVRSVSTLPVEGWEAVGADVANVLARHDIAVLGPGILAAAIDPQINVDTILAEPPFTVFDAWFHWRD
ncbi:hypothetical protein [Longispora urticae]